jgi:hypothetical protein
VILALEGTEASARDPAREHQTMLEGHSGVLSTVEDEGWNCNARQQIAALAGKPLLRSRVVLDAGAMAKMTVRDGWRDAEKPKEIANSRRKWRARQDSNLRPSA